MAGAIETFGSPGEHRHIGGRWISGDLFGKQALGTPPPIGAVSLIECLDRGRRFGLPGGRSCRVVGVGCPAPRGQIRFEDGIVQIGQRLAVRQTIFFRQGYRLVEVVFGQFKANSLGAGSQLVTRWRGVLVRQIQAPLGCFQMPEQPITSGRIQPAGPGERISSVGLTECAEQLNGLRQRVDPIRTVGWIAFSLTT